MPTKAIKYDLAWTTPCRFWIRMTGTIEFYDGPNEPGPMRVSVTDQKEKDMLIFSVGLPKELGIGVVQRELTVTAVGQDAQVQTCTPDVTVLEGFRGQPGDVGLSLVDIDKAGNRSPAHTQTTAIVDIISPIEPGDMVLTVTGEEADPEPPAPPEPAV